MLRRDNWIRLFTDSPIKKLLLPLITSLVLSACGGSSSNDSPTATISGSVQKGLFSTLVVNAKPIDTHTGEPDNPLVVTVEDQKFNVQIDKNQPILLEATSQFLNDINGIAVMLDQPLKVVFDVQSKDIAANINLATTLTAEKILQVLLNSNQPVSDVISQQKYFVNSVLGVPSGTDLARLDYSKISPRSNITDPNLYLLLLSAGIVNNLIDNNFYAGGFSKVVAGFVNGEQSNNFNAVYLYG